MVYISPEMALSETFHKLWKDSHFRKCLTAVVIDEAHCIDEWGDDTLYIANSTPSKITQAMKFLWFHALLLHELQHSISYGAQSGMETGHSGDWMWVQTNLISFTLHNLYQIPKTHYSTSLTSFPAY